MKRLIGVALPILALSGCAGTGYVHETYYGGGYYDPPPYPRTIYVQREADYGPRPRVVVVERPRTVVIAPPASHHRHVEQRRHGEERHEHHRHGMLPRGGEIQQPWGQGEGMPRTHERGEPRHEAGPSRELATRPLWRGREPAAEAPARHEGLGRLHQEHRQGREDDRPR